MMFSCWKCGAKIERPGGSRVLRDETCPKCDSDLHCCRNCRFYDPSKLNQCAETQAERVRDKKSANYCDYFQPNLILMARGGGSPCATEAQKKLDALFKV